MEVLAALSGCVLAAVAAFLAADAALVAPRGGVHSARRRVPHLKEAFVSWMELVGHWVPVVRVSNLAPVAAFSERLRDALAARGLSLTRRACVALLAVALAASMLLCVLVSWSPLGMPVGAAAVAASAFMAVGRRERAVRNDAAEQMPEVLRSLSAALGAGKSLPQAVEHVGRNLGEPMGSEFLKASFEIKAGRTVEDAVGDLCARVDAPGIALIGTALQISQRTGSPLNDLFVRASRMVSDSVGLRRELMVKTSQVRLSSKIVSALPVAVVGALVLLSADYRAGLALPAGRLCLCVAALLDVVALGLVQRLLRRSLA